MLGLIRQRRRLRLERHHSGTTLATRQIRHWILLLLAGLFEIVWAVGLKSTDGFTRFWPAAGTLAALVVSVGLLGLAARSLPIGTAYAVWTGVGAAGVVLCGILFLGEPATAMRLVCVALIVGGVIGLKAA
jgi:quaternary ammonium compound-resistance protein SugE